MWHDHAIREVFAKNFCSWLEQFAGELESGRYIVSREGEGLISVDDIQPSQNTSTH
jgi:hypothetical protein